MDSSEGNKPTKKFEFEIDSDDALYELGFQRDEFSRRWVEDYYPVNLSLFNLKIVTRCDVHSVEYHDQDFNLTSFPERFKPSGASSLYITGTTAPDKDCHLYRLFVDEDNKERASAVEVSEQMHVEIFGDDSVSNGTDQTNDLYLGQAMLPSANVEDGGSVDCSIQLKVFEEHLMDLIESIAAHHGSSLALRMHLQCRHMKRDGLVRNVSSSRIPDASLLLLEECHCLVEWISAVNPV